MCVHALVIVHFGSFGKMNNFIRFYPGFSSRIELWLVTTTTDFTLRLTRFLEAEYELRLILSCGQLEFRQLNMSCGCLEYLRLDTSYDWVELRRLDTSYGRLHPMADSSSGGWIRVTADSILQLTRVPVVGYSLRLTPSHGWLEFWQLDTGCGRFRPPTELSSGSWIRVTADYILRLTPVPTTGYDLRLIPTCGWLRVAADSILRLTRVHRLDSTCGWPIL